MLKKYILLIRCWRQDVLDFRDVWGNLCALYYLWNCIERPFVEPRVVSARPVHGVSVRSLKLRINPIKSFIKIWGQAQRGPEQTLQVGSNLPKVIQEEKPSLSLFSHRCFRLGVPTFDIYSFGCELLVTDPFKGCICLSGWTNYMPSHQWRSFLQDIGCGGRQHESVDTMS